jgi:hypothetical protein
MCSGTTVVAFGGRLDDMVAARATAATVKVPSTLAAAAAHVRTVTRR